MRIRWFVICSFIIFIHFFVDDSEAYSLEILPKSVVYNVDVGKSVIVYEYEDVIDDKKQHYISIYYKNSGIQQKILSNNGEIINSDMFFPSISDDGRFIVFTSRATNITDDEINKCYNIIDYSYDYCNNVYLYDVIQQKTSLIKNNDEFMNGDCYVAKISADGRNIVFESSATNNLNLGNIKKCIVNDINVCINIYKYNIPTKSVVLVSTGNENYGGDSNSISPSISDDGRYIVFQSSSSNLIEGFYNNNSCKNINEEQLLCSHIYLFDSNSSNVEIITHSNNILFDDNSGNAIISGDGKYIVYESYASNIEKNANNVQHVVLYQLETGKNKILKKRDGVFNNRDTNLKDISFDGKYIVFESSATNLNSDGKNSIYIYNVSNSKISLIDKFMFVDVKVKIDGKYICIYDNNKIFYRKIDEQAPVIEKNQIIYILKDSKTTLNNKISVSDNLLDNEEIEIYIENNLILNEIGEYILNVRAIDSFDNVSDEKIKVVVIEKDTEGPIFSDVSEIKVLKGSSTLNLLNYLEAIDKVDGNTRIYIVDDGNLDLNSSGKYKVKIMSKDFSENTTYKDLYIIVYENYNFEYYYGIALILCIIVVIIFSIIKIK